MNKLNIKYKLVDTAGQITAVILSETKREKQPLISKKLMSYNPKIEQAVFIEKNRIQAMGNELCINGSLAGGYLSGNSIIEISGLNKPVKFAKQNGFILARFPRSLLQSRIRNIIQLTGIVYIISNNKRMANKIFLKKLASNYGAPASGIIFYKKGAIKFLIYVKDTNSLVWENACGSASLAYSLFSNYKKIKQPSGSFIEIKSTKEFFTIKSPVSILK